MIQEHYHFEVIDSTNKKAKELADAGCPNGTLVTADVQQAGIGRRGRSWTSEEGSGIYMSMVLRPDLEIENTAMITLVAALAVAKAILEIVDKKLSLAIKWPNDIVLNKKKLCGILTEMMLKNSEMDYVVLGIGINVSNRTFPEDICATASSIYLETAQNIDKEQLIAEVWKQFEKYYKIFLETQDFSVLQEEYEMFLANKDMEVKVLDPLGEYTGVAKGITKKGELVVETESGIQNVSSGEVSVRGIYGYV